jgi:trans-2,3-dihydro-3-hydroxyanthranilate isomerase
LLNELDGKTSTGQRLVFEEGVGNVVVEVRCGGGTCFAELEVAQPVEVRPSPLDAAGLAALLSLSAADIDVNAPAPTAASCGVRFLLVPLASVAALERSRLDLTRWAASLQNTWAPQVYPYVLLDGRAGGNVRVRMFSPAFGIPEDPATGSAAAAFAAFMASLDPNAGDRKWTIQQGIEMGRPSTLYARSARRADGSTGVYVGGHAVRVSKGELLL